MKSNSGARKRMAGMAGVQSQLTGKKTDPSVTGNAKRPGKSLSTAPVAPPRLKSRSGGKPVKSRQSNVKPKR